MLEFVCNIVHSRNISNRKDQQSVEQRQWQKGCQLKMNGKKKINSRVHDRIRCPCANKYTIFLHYGNHNSYDLCDTYHNIETKWDKDARQWSHQSTRRRKNPFLFSVIYLFVTLKTFHFACHCSDWGACEGRDEQTTGGTEDHFSIHLKSENNNTNERINFLNFQFGPDDCVRSKKLSSF